MTKKPRSPKEDKPGGELTREQLLAFLAQNPEATKRDISRHFQLHSGGRIALKRMLREMSTEGEVTQARGRKLTRTGDLAEVTPVEIIEQDTDGELLCRPTNWEGTGKPPRIMLTPGSDAGAEGPALGIGERFLARLTRVGGGYEAKVIKRLQWPEAAAGAGAGNPAAEAAPAPAT